MNFSPRTARLGLGIGLPLAAALLALGPWLLLRDQLPNPIATHFDLSGTPNQSMSHEAFLVLIGTFVVSGMTLCVAVAFFSRRMSSTLAPTLAFIGAFLAGIFAAIPTVTALTQRGLDSWQDATTSLAWVGPPMLLGLLLATFAARCAVALPTTVPPPPSPEASPRLDLSEGETAVWATTQHAPWALFAAAGMVVAGLVLLFRVDLLAIALIVLGIGITGFASLRVRADRAGLDVKYGFLPWPRTRIPVSRIRTASVIDVRPMEWGGWGYRGSLRLMDRAAVVHRAGPGIRLDLVDGKVFVVTTDTPEQAVALLNAEVARGGGAVPA